MHLIAGQCVWKALFDPIGGRRAGTTAGGGADPAGTTRDQEELTLSGTRFNFLLTSRFRWLFRHSAYAAEGLEPWSPFLPLSLPL